MILYDGRLKNRRLSMSDYYALAYYKIQKVDSPVFEVKNHKKFFNDLDIKGRIYISEEGINGQVSVSKKDFLDFERWMEEHPFFCGCSIKKQSIEDHIFDRMTIKYRKELVAVGIPIDFSKRGEHISPDKWRETLDSEDENLLVIDVRNDYEGKVGHFEKAHIPPLKTFKEFPQYVEKLKEQYDPKKTKVLMYCTGGIRCEFFSPLMKEAGYENVFQLDGGVIGYGLKEGDKHWKGKLFVFDDRLVTSISSEKGEIISECDLCSEKTDRYVNCANMDCNKLFIVCDSCIEKEKGLCSKECGKGRIRPFKHEHYPKPFRRQNAEEKEVLKNSPSLL